MTSRPPSEPAPAPAPASTPQPVLRPERDRPRRTPPATRPNRSRRPLLALVAAIGVLGVGAGIGLLLTHHRSASTVGPTQSVAAAGSTSTTAAPPTSSAPTSSASPSPSPSPSSTLPPRQQAANALAALLVLSGKDRTSITQAVTAVEDCSTNLGQDETVFNDAASSRQVLLGKLAVLPDGSALPASMLPDLTTAWQASGQADQDFARWTQDEISQGCSTNYQSDADWQAAGVPDGQATKYKRAFVSLWSEVANEYGLPEYKYNQI